VTAKIVHHGQSFADRIAMFVIRTMVKLQPAADLGPAGRDAFDKLMARAPKATGIDYEPATVGGVPGWWCRPADASTDAAILYLHGGAYVIGSAEAYRGFVGQIVARSKIPAFIADYALAPERVFPAAVDDGESTYRGLADAGYSAIAIAGDSAGGALALVTAARMSEAAREGAMPAPAAVVAISPWTDLAMTGKSITDPARRDPFLTLTALERSSRLYLGDTDPKNPLASPLYGSAANLPPVLLHVGENEILFDDAYRFAELPGASAELHIWQGMVHVFQANPALLRAAREALDQIAAFLRQRVVANH
jgi:monoterpene epsilon-lactone hydrolase